MTKREIALDLETTGLRHSEGHKIIEVGLVEMIDGKPTGVELHFLINPERNVPKFVTDLTGIKTQELKDKPLFSEVAQAVRDFIGDSPVVIICLVGPGGYTLDREFLNNELRKANVEPVPREQWLNIRLWAKTMFGDENRAASFSKLLDRYKIDAAERKKKGHGALRDAQLLTQLYPQLKKDWENHPTSKSSVSRKKPRPKPPTQKQP